MIIENEYRVIGPPGCIAGDAIISVNRIGVGDAGITRKMRLDYLVERFNSAVPGGYFRGNGYARKTTTLWDSLIKTRVRCMSPEGLILLAPLVRAIDSGLQEVHEVVLENGCKLRATHDHEFAVVGGMASLSSLAAGDLLMVDAGVARKDPAKKKSYLEIEGLKYHPFCHRVAAKRYSVLVHRLTVEADMNGVSLQFFVDSHRNGFAGNANWKYLQKTQVVHHKDRDVKNNSIGNLEVIDSLTEHSRLHCHEGRWKDVIAKAATCKIAQINKYVGEYPTFDLTVYVEDGKSGNYLANDIIVSNCGKTTYLSSQVKQRVDRWCSDTGEEPRNCTDVLVSSLTKAAANEVLSRGLELPSEQIGTLHAHALHALGNPKLCVGPKQISQWNKESKMDHWLGGGVSERNEDGFDIGAGKYRGDSLNAEYTINRCRLVPREQWNQDVVDFATAYERWKYKNDYLDYTDLIHRAYERKVAPPGNPSTILVDECQDHDRAELRLLRYWATCVNKLIIVGDPDQNLYEWRGSDPGGFYESQIPPGQTKVLEQSYRVPRRVHSEAMQMIARSQDRTPVIYHPRDEEGEVDHACYSMRHHPQEVTRHIDELLQEPDSAPGRPKVMCLFSCAYMTNPLCAALRADGIPFWNPYSKERGNFNPLHPSKGVSTVQRLLAFLKPSRDCYGDQAKLWNWSEFHSWVELCTADGWLRHGAKANIKRRAAETPTQVMSLEDIDGVLASPAVMQDLQDVNLDFLGRFISDQKVNAYNFAVDVVRRRGYNDLLTNPRVVVGTIHCSPGDEPVLTNTGYVPIAELDHRKHLLCGYMHKCNRIVWGGHGPAIDDGKRGYGFRKCSRRYVGDLVVIETARSKTRVTPCHRIRVKYTKDYSSAWIVYLMRRGNWWRVGMCRAGKLGQRLSAERGDGAWIVGVFGNKDEAHVAEVRTQVTYGLASLVFVNKHKQAVVDSFHEEMSSVSGGRARRLLKDIKKLEEHPIHTRNGRIRDVTAFETVAANFISGFMLMPVAPVGLNTKSTGIKPDWITGTSHTQPFDGLVYSLEVLPHEHYISGGAVVHNSVKGAEADHVILCPDLSTQGWETFGTSAHRDSIHRLFYVGLTRAYRRLVLTAPSTPQAVQW